MQSIGTLLQMGLPLITLIGIRLHMPKRPATPQISPTATTQAWSTRVLKLLGIFMSALALSACVSLPSNGPTAMQVRKGVAKSAAAALPYTIVPINATTVPQLRQSDGVGVGVAALEALAMEQPPARADLIRRGDTLSISVFEVGVSLFGAGPAGLVAEPIRTPSAVTQTFTIQVSEDGQVILPYIGAVNAAGSYPEILANTIKQRLRRVSESPAVLVNLVDSVENVVYVGGVVSKSGRYRLTSAHERLLDVLSLAGGSPIDINELQLTLVRGDRAIAVPLNQISAGDPANIPLMPGDRIELVRVRQSYTVFGATDKVSQVPFEAKTVSLAEAVARVSGPSDSRANPRGVFIFRLEKDKDGAMTATVYQLDMMSPQTYFLAQMFPMQDKDVILFANSPGNAIQKFFGLINQLSSPALSVLFAVR